MPSVFGYKIWQSRDYSDDVIISISMPLKSFSGNCFFLVARLGEHWC
jgi:hypothetical protein